MKRPVRLLAALALLATLGLAGPAGALSLAQVDQDFGEAGGLLARTTVIVQGEGAPAGFPGSSGVLLHAEGYVLSDADATLVRIEAGPRGILKTHVGKATVRLPNGKSYPATLLKRDEATDSAILKIESKGVAFKAVTPGSSGALGVGSWTLVCGNSFGTADEGEPSVSLGMVSALRDGVLYTSAAVNPGSNGGPCVDAEGRLVGIVSTWEGAPDSPLYGLGRVIPIDRIRAAYAGLPEAVRLFPDPATLPPRRRDAALLEGAFRILARRGRSQLVSIRFHRPRGSARTERVQRPDGKEATVPRYAGATTGFLADREGHVLTAASNLWDFDKITGATAYLADGRELPARILGRDRVRGIALLKIQAENLPEPFEPAPAAEVKVGQFAFALGNPWAEKQGPDPLFTMGIVSALHQLDANRDAVQTDAGVPDGTAGGPLLDLQGRLLGLCTLQSPERFGLNSGIAFAIPSEVIQRALPALKEGRDVLPGWLGVALGVAPDGKVLIRGVGPGSPAERGGLKAGDQVTRFNEEPIGSPQQLSDLIGSLLAGDRVDLQLLRAEGTVELTVTLGERPD